MTTGEQAIKEEEAWRDDWEVIYGERDQDCEAQNDNTNTDSVDGRAANLPVEELQVHDKYTHQEWDTTDDMATNPRR